MCDKSTGRGGGTGLILQRIQYSLEQQNTTDQKCNQLQPSIAKQVPAKELPNEEVRNVQIKSPAKDTVQPRAAKHNWRQTMVKIAYVWKYMLVNKVITSLQVRVNTQARPGQED